MIIIKTLITLLWHILFFTQVIEDIKFKEIHTNTLIINIIITIYLNYTYIFWLFLVYITHRYINKINTYIGLGDSLYLLMIYSIFTNFSRYIDILAILTLVIYWPYSRRKPPMTFPYLPIMFVSHILNQFLQKG